MSSPKNTDFRANPVTTKGRLFLPDDKKIIRTSILDKVILDDPTQDGCTRYQNCSEDNFNSRIGQNTSRFLESNSTIKKVKELVGEAVVKGTHSGAPGNYSITYTFDNIIGTTSKGKKTSTLKVYLDDSGNVLNAYPVPVPKP